MSEASETPNRFFVYGTLKRGQLRETAWPRKPTFVSRATIRAHLHDLGAYPAITDGDDIVGGELWCFRPEDVAATIRTLDEIEWYGQDDHDLYVRRIVPCELESGESVSALTYFYAVQSELTAINRVLPGDTGRCVWPAPPPS